jgi:mono/diheme cytochrome c family protein
MRRKKQIAIVLMSAGTLMSCISVVASSQQNTDPPAPKKDDLPAGAGKEVFVRACTTCHASSTVTTQRKTADEWKTTISEMRDRGATVSDAETGQIIQYLATNFGPRQGDPPPKSDTAPPQ